jgi:hypothetical protein
MEHGPPYCQIPKFPAQRGGEGAHSHRAVGGCGECEYVCGGWRVIYFATTHTHIGNLQSLSQQRRGVRFRQIFGVTFSIYIAHYYFLFNQKVWVEFCWGTGWSGGLGEVSLGVR